MKKFDDIKLDNNKIESITGHIARFTDCYNNSYNGGFVFVNFSEDEYYTIVIDKVYGYEEVKLLVKRLLKLDHDNFIRLRDSKKIKVSMRSGLLRDLKRVVASMDCLDAYHI